MPARSDWSALASWMLLAALLAPGFALAQTSESSSPWLGEADQRNALQARPLPSPERLRQAPVKPLPKIEGIRPLPLDLNALARQGADLGKLKPSSEPASGLRIFITLEMPRASLVRLADQAARSGAVMVLRGLKAQSMRQTLETLQGLLGDAKLTQPNVHWVIDPQAFELMGVQSAPTFVLSLGDTLAPTFPSPEDTCSANSCGAAAATVSVAGDVTLHHALGVMARHSPLAAARAQPLLARLSTSPRTP